MVSLSGLICNGLVWNNVNKRESGEMICRPACPSGGLRMESCWRVAPSRILIVADPSNAKESTAMNLLHGDHATHELEYPLTTMLGSHEVGSPCRILVKGWSHGWYSWRTIDI